MQSNSPSRARRGFTLIETAVIFVIMALMLIIIVPHFVLELKARKAVRVRLDLAALDSALQHYALESGKTAGTPVGYADLRKYLDPQRDVYKLNGRDVFGDSYGPFTVGAKPTVPNETAQKFSSIEPPEFWSPYQ